MQRAGMAGSRQTPAGVCYSGFCEEISRSITEINSIASKNASSMQEAAQAVLELANQTQILVTLAKEMRVEEHLEN